MMFRWAQKVRLVEDKGLSLLRKFEVVVRTLFRVSFVALTIIFPAIL
jgi:hypothetical protein